MKLSLGLYLSQLWSHAQILSGQKRVTPPIISGHVILSCLLPRLCCPVPGTEIALRVPNNRGLKLHGYLATALFRKKVCFGFVNPDPYSLPVIFAAFEVDILTNCFEQHKNEEIYSKINY
ncbi:hypothetical protein J6590_039880 [Homalodisca vitripennis]|nr:hypothetical protein J6590_039880 [Homalodisca vitripennis]